MTETARYTIGKLAEAAGTTPRTIRYYTTEKLLPPPLAEGRAATYTEAHCNRLKLIQRLKNAFLPLDAIRNQIAELTDAQVERLLADSVDAPKDAAQSESEITRPSLQISAAEPHAERSGAAYVAQILAVSGQARAVETKETAEAETPKLKRALLVSPVFRPAETAREAGAEQARNREIWERITLTNGIELNVRVPAQLAERALLERRIAAAQAIFAEQQSPILDHAHPCNFRLHRRLDRGWGEMAFEYRWDSTSGRGAEAGGDIPDLTHCRLYEMATYAANVGTWRDGYFLPPVPPFPDWQFRDPTDGRSGPVGLECFPASQGWAWDRHTRRGRLVLPPEPNEYTIRALQTYRFQCAICGADDLVSGPDAGPHELKRTFAPVPDENSDNKVWRYTFQKHGYSAWMEIDAAGYVADSADIGFGPDAHLSSNGEISISL